MRIEQLIHFVEIADQQSISKAAKKLFIAQPSLSVSLNNLEESLSVKLFYRSSTGVQLTPQGKQVLQYARPLISQYQNIKSVSTQDLELTGTITLATNPAACATIVLELILALQKSHPKIQLHIEESRPKNVISKVLTNECTLGITSLFDFEYDKICTSLKEKSIKVQELHQDALCIFAHPEHPLVNKHLTTTLEEAKKYPFASFKKEIIDSKLPNTQNGNNNIEMPHITYRFQDRETIKTIVSKKIAIALLPKSTIQEDLFIKNSLLVPLEVIDVDFHLTTILLYKNNVLLTPEEKQAITLIQSISDNMDCFL